jgi:hypothetical protein
VSDRKDVAEALMTLREDMLDNVQRLIGEVDARDHALGAALRAMWSAMCIENMIIRLAVKASLPPEDGAS